MEHGPQVFLPNQELKNDIRNLNLTNKLIRKCKTLGREQRKRYIELGKYCEECNGEEVSDDEEKKQPDNIVIQEKIEVTPVTPTQILTPVSSSESQEPEKKKKVTKKSTSKERGTSESNTEEKKKRAPRKPKENK